MLSLVLVLLLGGTGTIRVGVEGAPRGAPVEVLAFRDGAVLARETLAPGETTVLLEGLAAGTYDLQARGAGCLSPVAHGVRTVADALPGTDVLLRLHPAFPVRVATAPNAVVWSGGGPQSPASLLLPAGLDTLVVDAPGKVSSPGRQVRVAGPSSLSVPLAEGLVVAGRILDPDGKPLEGAQVAVFADGLPADRSAFTDVSGRFAVGGFRGEVVSLRVTARGLAPVLRRVWFFPGEARARLDVSLKTVAATVVASATDEAGRPLLDAEAVLIPVYYESATAHRGLAAHARLERRKGGLHFRFASLVPGRRYRILFRRPGGAVLETKPFSAPQAGTTLRLPPVALGPAASLKGTVSGAIPSRSGLTVVCKGSEGDFRCRTDRLGRYSFSGLQAGPHVLFVKDVDERGVSVTLPEEGGAEETLVCKPASPPERLSGTVLDAEGKPLPGVEVAAAGRDVSSDDKGRFLLENLPAGRLAFRVTFTPGPGSRGLVTEPLLSHVEEEVRPNAVLRVRLERAGTLHVRLGESARRLARATLLADGTSGIHLERRIPAGAREVSIEGVPVGSYRVALSAPGVLGVHDTIVEVGPGAQEPEPLEVLPGRTVSGRVIFRRQMNLPGALPQDVDRPVANGWVLPFLPGEPLAAEAVPTDQDGSFRLTGLPLGKVWIGAAAPGRPPVLVPLDLSTDDAGNLTVVLRPAGEAAVVVRGPKGPLPQARVTIRHERGVPMEEVFRLVRFLGVVSDDSDLEDLSRAFRLDRRPDGRIADAFLQPGSYRFHIEAPGFQPADRGVRARTAAETARITATFPGVPPDLAAPVYLRREAAGEGGSGR